MASLSFSSSLSTASSLRRLAALPHKQHPRRNYISVPMIQSKIREIFMPALSSTMTEGKIVSWVKSEGDVLSKGDSVVVVESDKADMDVETFYDGILAAIVVGEGESAPVGAPIGLLAETEEEIAEAKAKAQSQAAAPAAPVPAPSPSETPVATKAQSSSPPPVAQPADGPKKTVATPYAKKLAKQHKVDINKIVGTGPFGRITPEDVEKAAGITPSPAKIAAPVVAPAPTAAAASLAKAAATAAPSYPEIPGSTVVPFTTMQSAVAKNMVVSLSVPTFRVSYPISTDALDALYEKVHFGNLSDHGFLILYVPYNVTKFLCFSS